MFEYTFKGTKVAVKRIQILDCDDSSVGYSIAYTAGAFSINERCTAVNVSTRTVVVIGSTGTLPGGILYTLTS